jgi:hypothetical protein
MSQKDQNTQSSLPINDDDNDILDYLGRDKLPQTLLHDFVGWCVWEQAYPALLHILERTGLTQQAQTLRAVDHDYSALAHTATAIGEHANEVRRQTGPLGLSTAEAAAFLVQKLALSAGAAGFDPEGVAFFTAQVCGWSGFADANFADPRGKQKAEEDARQAQRQQLASLWRSHGRND